MSDNILVKTDDGSVRYVARGRVGATGRLAAKDGSAAPGRVVKDVVDISAGLAQADKIRAGTQTGSVADAVKEGSSAIQKAMDAFRGLFTQSPANDGEAVDQAVRTAVTDVLSGPHPASQAPPARMPFWQRIAALLTGTRKSA